MEIPKPFVDETFRRTLGRFNLDMDIESTQLTKSRGLLPIFIGQILKECKEKNEIKFIEYIMYLKLYNRQKIIPLLSKKMKALIIQEIKNNYNIRIDYKGFDNYMNKSFEELAKNLGYRLVRTM
ncbi:hypothetical protein [uncultured Clostridium sp.]|uniref:hypothetical protein n=1 Tax=uncultured Clostridium sp. TaxID=59620 RepID=UPI0028EFAAD0|nr:hypothetical protein [uncultured Clostridium sp.]